MERVLIASERRDLFFSLKRIIAPGVFLSFAPLREENPPQILETALCRQSGIVVLDIKKLDEPWVSALMANSIADTSILITDPAELRLVKPLLNAGIEVFERSAGLKPIVEIIDAARRRSADSLVGEPAYDSPLLGESESAREARQRIRLFAPSDSPVLIIGENGTGKELIAQEIYRQGSRKQGLESINCGAYPETLAASELFGSVKGAYTDATDRAGVIERAGDGALFLDEIADLPAAAQTSLLRAIEGHPFNRLGGTRKITMKCRLICACNREIDPAKNRETPFRSDLFYRISTLEIRIKPLRERRTDIPMLAERFLRGHPVSRSAMRKITGYGWPGNIRQMINILERARLLSEGGEIAEHHIEV